MIKNAKLWMGFKIMLLLGIATAATLYLADLTTMGKIETSALSSTNSAPEGAYTQADID